MKKCKIYFADLTHTARGISVPTFPLGTSLTASYTKKELGSEVDVTLFKFPEALHEAILDSPPDILCLSSYSWCFELGYKLGSLAKNRNPGMILVFGGPNFPIEETEKTSFLQRYNAIDFFIELEGELGLVGLINHLLDHSLDSGCLRASGKILNNLNYVWEGKLFNGPPVRVSDPNIIPSPYLEGLMDEFFEYPISPMIETVRGCPFQCTFCADGIDIKSSIRKFDLARIEEEMVYIAKRCKKSDELIITDLNFGMYQQDVETAKSLANTMQKYNWPIHLSAAAGKNKPDRLIEIASILDGAWIIGSAMESSDTDVLKAIKRGNISKKAFNKVLEHGNNSSPYAQTYTEIILAIPKDSKETHFNSIRYGMKHEAKIIRMFQAILLLGTEMATQKTRDEHELETQYRVIPGSAGLYKFFDEKIPITEIEEIIVGNSTMSFEDYLDCRLMNLIVESFYNNAMFEEIYAFLYEMDILPLDIFVYLKDHPKIYPPKIKQIMDDFIVSNKKNLFKTRKELEDFALNEKTIKKFIDAEIGINEILVGKSSLYSQFESMVELLITSVSGYLRENDKMSACTQHYLNELGRFTVFRKKEFFNTDDETKETFDFDFKAIGQLGFKVSPSQLDMFSKKVVIRFYNDEWQKHHIKQVMGVYSMTPSGLGRAIQRSNLKKFWRQFDQFDK
ncbi:MAG: hypothetical protein CL402_00480 [Acidiferrobacteraceae bacterium]|nr:hypothetical protein [Acidiferrobacteraceae bacterium]|tara:strand:+ start:16873 stop:18909 length:2037 start_codon:yes stop_codon:yes gene_type:complete